MFSHPEQSGDNYVAYNINHNLNSTKLRVDMFYEGASAYISSDYNYNQSTASYGFQALALSKNPNTLQLRMYRLPYTNTNVYGKITQVF